MLICSCGSKKKSKSLEMQYFLTNNSEKYWTSIEENPIRRGRQGLVFYKNGYYNRFWFNNDSIGRFINNWGNSTLQWTFLNDSLLFLGVKEVYKNDSLKFGSISRVEYLNEDILILNNLEIKELSIFIKSKDQKTRLKQK